MDISVTGLYLSPMTLQVKLERAEPVALRSDDAKPGTYIRWISALNVDRVTLTTKAGMASFQSIRVATMSTTPPKVAL